MDSPAPKCPHCDQEMDKWAVPDESTWPDEYHFVCFNDDCPYYLKGWEWMDKTQGARCSYRYMCGAHGRKTGPLSVPTPESGRDRIVKKKEDEDPGIA